MLRAMGDRIENRHWNQDKNQFSYYVYDDKYSDKGIPEGCE
jgi:hypothetical protein